MKTPQTRYHKLDLDEKVARQLEENKQRIIIDAENYAVRCQPPLQSKKLPAYFHENHLQYQAPIDTVNKDLQFKASCHHVTEHKQLTETQLRNLNNKLSVVKEKQIAIDSELKGKKPPFGKGRMLFVWIATCAICLFDGLLAIPVFETWGYSLISAFLMGLLFAFVLALIAHFIEHIVLKGRTLWQRRIIALILILLLALLFYFMGSHRAEYLEQQVSANALQAIHFSPWPFTLISLLLFTVAVAVHHFYHPSPAQRAAMQEYRHLLQAKQDNEAEQEKLKQEAAAIEQEHVEVRQMNASILEYGCMLEQLIISKAHEGFALWKKHNMMHRPDNGRPICFDDANYPFTFNTNFHSIKQLNHENHA